MSHLNCHYCLQNWRLVETSQVVEPTWTVVTSNPVDSRSFRFLFRWWNKRIAHITYLFWSDDEWISRHYSGMRRDWCWKTAGHWFVSNLSSICYIHRASFKSRVYARFGVKLAPTATPRFWISLSFMRAARLLSYNSGETLSGTVLVNCEKPGHVPFSQSQRGSRSSHFTG